MDVDFCFERREEVIEYVKRKYGEKAVSGIVTFGTFAARGAVRDVTRVMDYPYNVGDKIAKAIPLKLGMTIKKALEENPELKTMYDTEPITKKILDTAMRIEGLPRHSSRHACFSEDTLIHTQEGFKKIIDIKKGDKVLTHNKRYMPVVDIIKTKTDTIYTVKTVSSFPVDVTGNHPFLIREMKYENYKIKSGKWGKRKAFGKPIWKEVSELTIGKDYVGIPINQESIIPEGYDLPFNSDNFWWLIGRYIGDGWTEVKEHKNTSIRYEEKVVLSCPKKEEEKELIQNVLNELGFKYWLEDTKETYKFNIYEQELFDYLQEFGQYAYGKKLNNDVLNLPIALAEKFLIGYFSADGYWIKKENRYSIKTVSKNLAIGTMQMIHKVYHRPVAIKVLPTGKNNIQGRIVNRRETYEISFTKDTREKERSFYENGYIWSRLSVLNSRKEDRDMYNLTVLNDSSYTANNMTVHNCGTIIAAGPVNNYLPEFLAESKDKKGKERTAQVTMTEVEELGLLKMDFLGLKTMTVIGKTIESINRNTGDNIKYLEIPHDDPYVYRDIARGESHGVFQLESPGMRKFMSQLYSDVDWKIKAIENKYNIKGFKNPEGNGDKEAFIIEMKSLGQELFERLVAGVSLYRPGPMDYLPNYLKGMENPDEIKYLTPKLEPILKSTYGTIVYQEQVMQIVQSLAGYSLGRADLVRRAMGKKKIKVMEQEKEYFIYGKLNEDGSVDVPGCVGNDIPKAVAEEIWEQMADFCKYAFNKSHAAVYAYLSAITGWLKYYYPIDFMAETMNVFISISNKLTMYLSVVNDMNIEILPPDVNKSGELFMSDGKNIRFGLRGIRNLGKTAELIINEREVRGIFKDYQEFAVRMATHQNIDKKVLDGLIYSGALDSFEGSRKAKLQVLGLILEEAKIEKVEHEAGQVTFFDIDPSFNHARKIQTPDVKEFEKRYKLEKEKEYAGFYVTEHPLDDYVKYFKDENITEIGYLLAEAEDDENNNEIIKEDLDGTRVKIAGIINDKKTFFTKKDYKPIYTFKIEGKTGEIKAVMFSNKIEEMGEKVEEKNVIIAEGILKEDNFGLQLIVNDVVDITKLKENENKQKILAINVIDEKQLDKLNNEILNTKAFNGNIPVYINLKGKKLKADKKINLDLATISKLDNIFADNYRIIHKKN